ncbi:hypothetical protein ACOMHN_009563 [Nucella lapillus]
MPTLEMKQFEKLMNMREHILTDLRRQQQQQQQRPVMTRDRATSCPELSSPGGYLQQQQLDDDNAKVMDLPPYVPPSHSPYSFSPFYAEVM